MIGDEALEQLLSPPHQVNVGPVFDPDPISRLLPITGQLNPVSAREFAAQNGRYLSGFGSHPTPPETEIGVERAEHAELFDLENEDDVLGSGIFDPSRRPATSNANTGVFASHYSLPGYQARETPFVVNPEITDLTDDASIVTVPGGGMAYVESRGRLLGPACPQQPPPPRGLSPAHVTSQYETYAQMDPNPRQGWDVDSLLRSVENPPYAHRGGQAIVPANVGQQRPQPAFASGGPGQPGFPATITGGRTPGIFSHPTGGRDGMFARPVQRPQGRGTVAPSAPQMTAGGNVSQQAQQRRSMQGFGSPAFPSYPGSPCNYPFPPSHPQRDPMWQVHQLPTYPRNGRVPGYPSERMVPRRMQVTPDGAGIAMSGTEMTTGTWAMLLGVGVVAGVAVRMIVKSRKAG